MLPGADARVAIWSNEGRNQNTRNYAHVILFDSNVNGEPPPLIRVQI